MKAFRLFWFVALLLACLGLGAVARPGSAYDPFVATYTWDSSVPNYNAAATIHPETIDTTSLVMADFLGRSGTQPSADSWGDSGAIVGWDDDWAAGGTGNANGDLLDGLYVQIYLPHEGWWDLGVAADRVVVFTSQDHGPYPAEGLEYRVYGCNNLWDASTCGTQATLTDVYLDGWRDYLTQPCTDSNNNGWCSDDVSAVLQLDGNYQYIRLVGWGGGTYTEPEIDAVAPFPTHVDKVIAALWADLWQPMDWGSLHVTATPELPAWFDMTGGSPPGSSGWPANPSSGQWPPLNPAPQVAWGVSGTPVMLFTDELDWSSWPVQVTKTATLWGYGTEKCWVDLDDGSPMKEDGSPVSQAVFEDEPQGFANLTQLDIPLFRWRIQLPGSVCYAKYCVVKTPMGDVDFNQPAEACLWLYDPIVICRDSDTLNCPNTPPCPDGVADPEAAAADSRCGPPDNSPDTYNPDQGVGGIVELQVSGSGPAVDSARSSGGSSAPPYAVIAGGAAAAVLALTAGAWYARRRWLG